VAIASCLVTARLPERSFGAFGIGMLRLFIGDRTAGRLFQSRTGTPLAHGNLRNRVLHPLLERLGIPKAGLKRSGIQA
jgi:hypothetical protein